MSAKKINAKKEPGPAEGSAKGARKTSVKKESAKAKPQSRRPFRPPERTAVPVPPQRRHARAPGELIVYCWNVNGIRAAARKGFLEWMQDRNPDVLCVQEIKAAREQIEKEIPEILNLEGYDFASFSAEKKGYSGVATFTRKTLAAESRAGFAEDHELKFNEEGRVLVTTFGDFEIWNAYYPNGGRGPERVEYKLKFYDHCFDLWQKRRKEKKLILCGDFNTAHKEIDLARPRENEMNTGFLPEERAFLDRLTQAGYEDVFRRFEQGAGYYTYWDQVTRARDRNVGWRIDYFFVASEAREAVLDAWLEMEVPGSDHCPLGLALKP